ncbi:MAG: regulatory signaling modulator protein AmpE [Xanthomonadaceae bacterium]|nr:regulatory signaling modulator protein AmpE [Xanthomonadaceae bacterium]
MRLIAILLALWANQHPRKVDSWRSPEPFLRYLRWLERSLWERVGDHPWLRLALALLPPVLLFALLQVLLEGWLLGLAEIALGAWALLFLHGPGSPDEQVRDFCADWREGRIDSARSHAAELTDSSTNTASAASLPLLAAAGLFWQSYRRWLSGIFWLLLLGPVGPVALRLIVLLHEHAQRQSDDELADSSNQLLALADWLPARAAALSFALAGSFVHARDAWRKAGDESDQAARLVAAAGVGALHIDDAEEPFDPESDDVEEFLQDARELVGRSSMIWVAVAALLTIAGWLY